MDIAARANRPYSSSDLEALPQLRRLSPTVRKTMRGVAAVLPFRVNEYVLQELIDWSRVPDDPIFRLVFPQPGMLLPHHLSQVVPLIADGVPEEQLKECVRRIHFELNAHPAGQETLNVPRFEGNSLLGVQHKYRETVLFFPSAGQQCYCHCTYCFRWAQFAGSERRRFGSHESNTLVRYLREHPEVTDVLVTGGDPLVMATERLREYLEPVLHPSLEHIRTIRIGTKSLTYWPHRFVSDPDACDLLHFFEEIRDSGRHLALMAHVSHPRELEPTVARAAVKRIQDAGAVIRTQSPVVRGVNDDPQTWKDLWTTQVRLGMVPYYMFVARETGAQHYFKIPLLRALEIFDGGYRRVSGLGRTARGPVMSASPGKVLVAGRARVFGEDVFVLKFLQGRDPSWVGRTFFARLDPDASWLSELQPAFGKEEFFFESRFREIKAALRQGRGPRWSHPQRLPLQHLRNLCKDPVLRRQWE